MRAGKFYLIYLERGNIVHCAVRQDSSFLHVYVISPAHGAPNRYPTANICPGFFP